MSTVLVTGANGFIGGYLVRRLLASGATVRALVRRPESLPADIRPRVALHQGDVRDEPALQRAVDGASTVFHLAACARAWARDPGEFRQVNVDAVAALVHAAERYGVTRLVHVSTVLTLPQFGAHRCATPYEESKLAGEHVAASFANTVIVHPTRVYGAGPLNDANGVTRVIAAYLQGRFRVRLRDHDVQGNYVHARDVARGIMLAARHGAPGAHYVLGGENASLRELLAVVARVSRVRRRVLQIPPCLALTAASVAELWGRLGGEVPITRAWVRVFLEDQRTFGPVPPGYSPRSLEIGVAETIWWLRNGRRAFE